MYGSPRTLEPGARTETPATVPRREPGTRRRTWRGFPAELADVLCVECAGAGLPLQAREELALVLARSAARMVDPQGRASPVGPGDVGIGRPGEMYRLDAPADGAPLRVLLVGPEMLAPPVPARPPAEPLRFRAPVARDPELAARLHALFGELGRGLTALDALDRFRGALADLAARHLPRESASAARRVHPGAARALAHLVEHLAEPVPLDALVAASRLSRFYLLRVFRRDYGVSPHQYQRHLRLARACRLLAAGASPAEAAYGVGFSDQSHLSRLLKGATGLTPGAFARQWAGAGRGGAELSAACPP